MAPSSIDADMKKAGEQARTTAKPLAKKALLHFLSKERLNVSFSGNAAIFSRSSKREKTVEAGRAKPRFRARERQDNDQGRTQGTKNKAGRGKQTEEPEWRKTHTDIKRNIDPIKRPKTYKLWTR